MVLRCTYKEIIKNLTTEETEDDRTRLEQLGFHQQIIYNISLIMSIIGLLVTFVIYMLLPDFKNLHGRIVLNNTISVTFLTIYLLIIWNTQNLSYSLCKFLGYSGYFSGLSMLTWMTVMCVDLYSTFRKAQLSSNNPLSKYLVYLAFGWGFPAIMTIVVFLLQIYLPKESSFNPGIGENFKHMLETGELTTGSKCFLTPSSEKIWFYLPMLVILSINSGVYMTIIIKLAIAKWETRNVRLSTNQRSINSDLVQQLVICNIELNYFKDYILGIISETVHCSWYFVDF